jgi:hypothetical protein
LSVEQTNEWSLLKDQFDALVRDEDMREDSIEKICDDQIRRRFAEWIIRAVEYKSIADSAYLKKQKWNSMSGDAPGSDRV